MRPLSETRRLIYGGVGLVVGIAINRISGLHIILRHIAIDGLVGANTAWLVVFVLGFLTATLTPMWFWLLRPTVADRAQAVDPHHPANE